MHTLGKVTLLTLGTLGLGIAGGYLITSLLAKSAEKKIGGKLMKVHYRFTKDFEDEK